MSADDQGSDLPGLEGPGSSGGGSGGGSGSGRVGGGFIRVGNDGSVERAKPWLHTGGPTGPPDDGNPEPPGDGGGGSGHDDDGLPWVPSPRAGLLGALVVVAAAIGGSTFATWRVDRGEAVPCESFLPNPAVWHRISGVTPGEPTATAAMRPATWPTVLREIEGSIACAKLEGRSRSEVVRMLGEPPAAPGTAVGEELDLGRGELAWVARRGLVVTGNDAATTETAGFAVRFAGPDGGSAVAVRRIDQRR